MSMIRCLAFGLAEYDGRALFLLCRGEERGLHLSRQTYPSRQRGAVPAVPDRTSVSPTRMRA